MISAADQRDTTSRYGVSATLGPVVTTVRRTLDLHAAFAATTTARGFLISERDGLEDPRWGDVMVRPGRGLGGRVIDEGSPIALGDYLHDSTITGDYRPIVKAEGLRSIACVPIQIEGRTEALLYLALREAGGLGSRLVDHARQVADLAVLSLLHDRARSALAARAHRAIRRDDGTEMRAIAERLSEYPHGTRDAHTLTPRQMEVLDLLAAGASNAQLALRLGIAETTAKEHVGNLCRKLGASSRLELVSRARDGGLI